LLSSGIGHVPIPLFPPLTLGQVQYRLTKCGELCLGIFSTIVPGSGIQVETAETARPVETSRRNGALNVLLGHVLATKTNTPLATDASMDYPRDWDSEHPSSSDLGHQEAGRTIVLHSVAVAPGVQGRGIGRVLLLSYMQHMNGAGIADRLVLIAHDVSAFIPRLATFANMTRSIWLSGMRDLALLIRG
jgi:ribosomal protein S18 acetylase RimI-like enzyme